MRDIDQTIIKFDYEKNFKNDDFYLSKSNKHVFDFLNVWPKWERNFLNITGEKLSGKTHLINIFLHKNKGIKFEGKSLENEDFYLSKSNKHVFDFLNLWPKWERNFVNVTGEKLCGKTHLMNIFLHKNKGIKFEAKSLKNDHLKNIKIYENIIIENLSSDVNERLLYSLLNLIEQDNKFIIVTSKEPIIKIGFDLKDLRSRAKNFILLNIEKPDDELIFAIILKNLSDRQISLDDKFIEFIIKRIERSYSKIYDFIYKIDQLSLKKKKSIDFKIIKEVLGE